MTQIENTWRYGQVKSNALNVRREPSRKARRWNNVWPMNVGVVAAVTPEHIIAWEGNAGKKVAQRTYSLHDTQILGYGRPQYCEHSKMRL